MDITTGYNFEKGIKALSFSQDLATALRTEWTFITRCEFGKGNKQLCICNHKIAIGYMYYNNKTQKAIYAGSGCTNHFKDAQGYAPELIKKGIDMILEAGDYGLIQDYKAYSQAILTKIMEWVLDIYSKNFNNADILEHTLIQVRDLIRGGHVLEPQFENVIDKIKAQIKNIKNEEAQRAEQARLMRLEEQQERKLQQEEQQKARAQQEILAKERMEKERKERAERMEIEAKEREKQRAINDEKIRQRNKDMEEQEKKQHEQDMINEKLFLEEQAKQKIRDAEERKAARAYEKMAAKEKKQAYEEWWKAEKERKLALGDVSWMPVDEYFKYMLAKSKEAENPHFLIPVTGVDDMKHVKAALLCFKVM
jgi:hypothetical protein